MKQSYIVLPSRYGVYESLREFVASFVVEQRYSDQFVAGLQLSVKEAFVNAVKHGNGERDNLTISCTLVADDRTLLVSMQDCGNGFQLADQPNPLDPPHCFKLSGRGLSIIRSVAESVTLERHRDGSALLLRYIPY